MSAGEYVEGVASDNLGDVSTLKLIADWRTLHGIGVRRIGWQEAGDRSALFNVLAIGLWATYRPLAAGAGSVPISWHRPTYKVLARGWRLCVPSRYLGPKGAGPSRSKPKGVTWLRLRHRASGQTECHLNTHMIVSAARGDLPLKEHLARVAAYEDQVDGIVKLVRELRVLYPHDRIVLTLDSNADPKSQLVRPLVMVGFRGWTPVGTHGRSRYDHVVVVTSEASVGSLTVSGAGYVPALSGDHRKPVRRLTYRRRPSTDRSPS